MERSQKACDLSLDGLSYPHGEKLYPIQVRAKVRPAAVFELRSDLSESHPRSLEFLDLFQ